MAKDTTILFVYDTELLKNEEDDPNSAILYFYPSWVTEQQKTALCGQLMGTILCLKRLFSVPKFVAIQTGKFRVIENGRYILALGTDKNISENILEHRINIIWSLLVFFHKDLEDLAKMYSFHTLKSKLSAIFDALLKILFVGGNLFNSKPFIIMSAQQKTANCSSLNNGNAVVFLEKCQQLSNVLGGVIFYQNKLIATQLSISTTKNVILSNPLQIKYAAERIEIDFKLPKEVHLFEVYITDQEFIELLEHRCFSNRYLFKKGGKKNHTVDSVDHKCHNSQHQLLYTTVPEEDHHDNIKETVLPDNHVEPKQLNSSRPNSLNLNSSIKLNHCSIRIGVATTPMAEQKTFIPTKNHNISKNQDGIENFLRDQTNSIPNNNNQQYSANWNVKISKTHLKRSKSIHDPCYPLFKTNGCAASKFYSSQKFTSAIHSLPIDLERKNAYSNKSNRKLINTLKFLKSPSYFLNHYLLKERQGKDIKEDQVTPLMNKLKIQIQTNQDDAAADMQKCVLFVSGRKGAYVTLLLHQQCSNDRETIIKLWELCQEYLPQLEEQQKTMALTLMNKNPEMQSSSLSLSSTRSNSSSTSSNSGTSMCSVAHLRMNSYWDKIEKNGEWVTDDESDENVLYKLHGSFQERNNDVSEVLLRKPESLIYAYPEGDIGEFYRVEAPPTNGLPHLNDPMASLVSRTEATNKQRFKLNQ